MPMSRRQVETVSELLYLDALIRIDEGDLAGAADEIKAIVNAGRALGNEPTLGVQAGRVTAVVTAAATLERLRWLAASCLRLSSSTCRNCSRTRQGTLQPWSRSTATGPRPKSFWKIGTGRAGIPALFESPFVRSFPAVIYS